MSNRRLVWIETCPACVGKGHYTTIIRQTPMGNPISDTYACQSCKGTGEIRTELTAASSSGVRRPGDDGDTVSIEWVEKVSDEPIEGMSNTWVFLYDDLNPAFSLVRFQESNRWGATLYYVDRPAFNWPHDITTRGQLRRLSEALGVELKEGAR